MQVPAVTQLWAGHRGHWGDLDTGEFLLLQAGGWVGEGEYTLKDSTGNTRCDKGKVQGMGGGVGSPQRWPVPPEARRRLLGNQHLRASQAERSKQARGRAASAGLGGTRRLPLCLLTEQMWAQPPLLGCFSGSPWLPFPGSKALLGHTHTTPLNFCPELLTPRGLWLESPADAPVGCGLRNLMTSRVWGLHADLTVIPPG